MKYFADKKKYTKFGLLYQDDEMGAIMKKGVEDELAVLKMKLTAAESYKRGATDFSSQIAKLKKAGVQIVVLATVIRETVGALKEANKLGWKVDMCGMTPAYNIYVPLLCKKAGFSPDGLYATGQTLYPYPDSKNDFVRVWVKRHTEWFKKPPDLPTIAGWQGLSHFATAAKRVGKDLTREKLIDELEKFKNEPDSFGGPTTTFTSKSHKGVDKAIMFQIQKGKWVPLTGPLGYK